jgi:hypothetical protein
MARKARKRPSGAAGAGHGRLSLPPAPLFNYHTPMLLWNRDMLSCIPPSVQSLLAECERLRQPLSDNPSLFLFGAPESIEGLWREMERIAMEGIGVAVPPRPDLLRNPPPELDRFVRCLRDDRESSLAFEADVRDAINIVVAWCWKRIEDDATARNEGEPIQYVTLDQAAAVVNRSKKTLERLKSRKNNPLPNPDIEGGGGKPDEWNWDTIRPWMEKEYKRPLSRKYSTIRR